MSKTQKNYPGKHPLSRQPKPIDCPTVAEVQSIIYTIGLSRPIQLRRRDTLIVLLMARAGLRLAELLALRWDDLMQQNTIVQALKVRQETAKYGSTRTIPLDSETQAAISGFYHDDYYHRSDIAHKVFAQKTHAFDSISHRAVQKMIETVSMAAIGRRLSPHSFRHHAATELMKVTNQRVVQAFLGHRQLSTTSIYTHPDQNDMREAILRRA